MIVRTLLLLAAFALPTVLSAAPLSVAAHAKLAAGKSLYVIVQVDGTATDAAANAERSRRALATRFESHDDEAVVQRPRTADRGPAG